MYALSAVSGGGKSVDFIICVDRIIEFGVGVGMGVPHVYIDWFTYEDFGLVDPRCPPSVVFLMAFVSSLFVV